jgi:hypothetical protein
MPGVIRPKQPRTASLLCAWGSVLVVAGCGGSEEVVRAPAAKVVWGAGEAAPEAQPAEDAVETAAPAAKKNERAAAPAAVAAQSEEEAAIEAGAIDLDAPPERAATPAPAAATGKAATGKAAAGKAAADEEPGAEAVEASASAPPPLAELQRRRNEKERGAAKSKTASAKKPQPAEPPAASAYQGAEPCRAASFSIDRVRAACESGGRPGAKRVMKEAINKATATGKLLKCGDCHSNTRDYALKSDAADKLQSWL